MKLKTQTELCPISRNTKTFKLLKALMVGSINRAIGVNEARQKLGIKNLRAEVSRIREAGYVVVTLRARNTKGQNVLMYALSQASLAQTAAGYVALQLMRRR